MHLHRALNFDNTYARDLSGLYADALPTAAIEPRLVAYNHELGAALGFHPDDVAEHGAAWFSGTEAIPGSQSIAQAYAGHQFGSFNPGLGDGRAVLLGEIVTAAGSRVDLALKGSGRTPYSRGGDGRATIAPVLREYLMGEAMHALGIPTTRALAAVRTGDMVVRRRPEPGAVLTRVAASHLRVGTFQYFAARQRPDDVARLVAYATARHGDISTDRSTASSALELLRAVVDRQAYLVAQWIAVGFVHGVMNTDNCSISGETIDYGPCAFVEPYDLDTVYSSIDEQGRYAFGQQPAIAGWNMARLAEALIGQIEHELATDTSGAVDAATEVVNGFSDRYQTHRLVALRTKLGLRTELGGDAALADDWLALLGAHRADLTAAWRELAGTIDGTPDPLRSLFGPGPSVLVDAWLARYHERLADEPDPQRATRMRSINPAFVPRNEHVEVALDAAVEGDLAPFEQLVGVLTTPFDEHPEAPHLARPSSQRFLATHRTFCGT